MTRLILSRLHPARPDATQADVTGMHAEHLAKILGRSRIGTALTLWTDSVTALGGLARVTRVSPAACVVDVLVDGEMREVLPAGAPAEYVVMHPLPALARAAVFARSASLVTALDAAFVAQQWVRHERLTREWTTTDLR